MKVRSLSHVGITVTNFGESIRWYNDMFGFKLINEESLTSQELEKLSKLYNVHNSSVKFGLLVIPKGGIIEIFEFSNKLESPPLKWNMPGTTHLCLAVRNVPKWYDTLKSKGVKFLTTPQQTGSTHWVFLQDPDGNLIELIDLKFNYTIIRFLGRLVGKILAKSKFKRYYTGE